MNGTETQNSAIRTSLVTNSHSAGRVELCQSQRLWCHYCITWHSGGGSLPSVIGWCIHMTRTIQCTNSLLMLFNGVECECLNGGSTTVATQRRLTAKTSPNFSSIRRTRMLRIRSRPPSDVRSICCRPSRTGMSIDIVGYCYCALHISSVTSMNGRSVAIMSAAVLHCVAFRFFTVGMFDRTKVTAALCSTSRSSIITYIKHPTFKTYVNEINWCLCFMYVHINHMFFFTLLCRYCLLSSCRIKFITSCLLVIDNINQRAKFK